MKKSHIVIGSLAAFVAPALAFAQTSNTSTENVKGIVVLMNWVVQNLLPFMMVLVFVYFFYGLAVYVLSSGDAEKASEGKTIMIHGVIALFIGVSIYGIIAWLQVFFNAQGTAAIQTITTPTLNVPAPSSTYNI